MAQRDYVSKKHDRPKKRRSGFAFHFMIAISVIVIILFIAVLYSMARNKSNLKPEPEVIPETEKPEVTLPEKPQERWTYLKQLENPDNDELRNEGNISDSNPLKKHITNTYPVRGAGVSSPETSIETKPKETLRSQKNGNTVAPGRWVIQCGAFKDRRNAESLKARIAMAGFDSQIQRNTLYRVLVGMYSTKHDAEKVMNQLKDSEITNCIVNKN